MNPTTGSRALTGQATRLGAVSFCLVVLALLAPALGGATRLWAQAVVVLGLAVVVFVAPAGRLPPKTLLVAGGALLGLGAVGFVPVGWFAAPAWREQFVTQHEVALAGTLSPQPWVTAEQLALFGAGLLWAAYLCAHAATTKLPTLGRAYGAVLMGLVVLALAAEVAGFRVGGWEPQGATFGFFPNRNQTGNLIGIGAVLMLALAFDGFDRRRPDAGAWVLGYVVCLAALIVNGSRGGVLIFFGGSLAWVLWVAVPSRRRRKLGLAFSALLLGLAVFLAFGGRTLERFIGRPDRPVDYSEGFRLKLQADALRLVRDGSWHGIGLGNFDPVFARYRQASRGDNRAIHPESDWLWLAAEMGWLAPWWVWGAAGWWLWRQWPRRGDADFPVAAAVVVGALAFLAHGFVDVSGHRMGTVWPMLFLVGSLRRRGKDEGGEVRPATFNIAPGAASRTRCSAVRRPDRTAVCCWRVAAVGLAIVSIGWLSASVGQDLFPTSTLLDRALSRMARAQERGQFDYTVHLANAALRFAPLKWELYFYRALGRLYASGQIDRAVRDFRRARWLEPLAVQVPFQEGLTWLAWQPALAPGAWQEALRRPAADPAALYRRMLDEAGEHPELRDDLRLMALDDPELLLVFLEQATPAETTIEIERLLQEDPDLARLTATQRQRLLLLWARRGDRERLAATLDAKPQWREASWQAHALVLAGQGHFQAACELAQRSVLAPALPPVATTRSVADLQRDLLMRPDDFVAGFALYRAQRTANQRDDALATLRRLTPLPACPRYFHYLEAQLAMELGQWQNAWGAWRRFLDR